MNRFSNRATWNVWNTLHNPPHLMTVRLWGEYTSPGHVDFLADRIKWYVRTALRTHGNHFGDMSNLSFQAVNWREVAGNLFEEYQ